MLHQSWGLFMQSSIQPNTKSKESGGVFHSSQKVSTFSDSPTEGNYKPCTEHGTAKYGLLRSRVSKAGWGRKPEQRVPEPVISSCFPPLIFPSLRLKVACYLELYKYRWRAPSKIVVSGSRHRKWMTCAKSRGPERVREVSCFMSPLPCAASISYRSHLGVPYQWQVPTTPGTLSLVHETIDPQIVGRYLLIFSLFVPLPWGPGGRLYGEVHGNAEKRKPYVYNQREPWGIKNHQGDPGWRGLKRLSLKVVYDPLSFPWAVYA